MSILIDGYNLMHAAGLMRTRFGPHGLEKARRALLGVLASSLAEQADETTVVFDAKNRPDPGATEAGPSPHHIRVLFAVDDPDADTLIERLVCGDPVPRQLTVVSGDRRIRNAAERRGARSIDSETFWQSLVTRRRRRPERSEQVPENKPGRLAGDREFWLRQFDGLVSEDELRELAGLFSDDSPGETSV